MSSIMIDISELRSAYGEKIEDLEKFLKEKTKAKIDVADREITLTSEEKTKIPDKNYLKVLLKKYLHTAELRDEFRVTAGKENTLVIRGRRIAEEE